MSRFLWSLFPAILSMSRVGAAQGSRSPVASGTRVRLFVVDTVNRSSDELRYTYPAGKIVGFASGSVILRSDSSVGRPTKPADMLHIPLTNIGSAEAFAGLKRHALYGAIIGFAIGGTVGYIVGHEAYGSGCVYDAEFRCRFAVTYPDTRIRTGLSVAGIGALAGAAVGYLIRTEQWSHVDVSQLQLQVGLR